MHPRFVRLSLFRFIVLVLTVGAGLGWIGYYRVRNQHGQTAYESLDDVVVRGAIRLSSQNRSSRLMRILLGDDKYQDVTEILFYASDVDESDLNHLKHFPRLRYLGLDVSDCNDNWLQKLEEIRSIDGLNLNGTRVTDLGLSFIHGLGRLESINLDQTLITNAGIRLLHNFPNLRRLSLGNNRISDEGILFLNGMTQLEDLNLQKTFITDDSLQTLAMLPNIRHLDLDHTAITNKGLDSIVEMTRLESLSVRNTRITEAGADRLMRMQSLRRLSLDETNISNLQFEWGRSRVFHLSLCGTPLTDREFEDLRGARSLVVLVLDRTMITDCGLVHMANLHNLRTLSLRATGVTEAGIEKLKVQLPNCEIRF